MREIDRANVFPALRGRPGAASTRFWGNRGRQAGGSRVLGACGRKNSQNNFFSEKPIFYSDIRMERVCCKKPNTPKLKMFLTENKIISRAKSTTAECASPLSLCSPGRLLPLEVCPPVGSEPGDCPKDSSSKSKKVVRVQRKLVFKCFA